MCGLFLSACGGNFLACSLQFVFCCWFVLFFFFKQKTAYEMRISDWSSDVCSSDLQKVLNCCAPPRCQEDGAQADCTLPDLPTALEIGRASCRERVCQYV